jgi:poly(A) polymerase
MSLPSHEVFRATEISDGLCPILTSALDPDATSVLVRLHRAGHRAYLVGGCVRDLLLGGTPKDFDVATSARPRQVKKVFRNSRIIGRRFRLVHVMFGQNKAIEVSTFRRDPNAEDDAAATTREELERDVDPAGAPAWESTALRRERGDAEEPDDEEESDEEDEDLLIREDNVYGSEAEDAVRRDFTINGLFYDVQSQTVLDYVGGVADLRRRVLRTIGEAARRVREDPVRILRAVKFAVRLDLSFDPGLAVAMAEHHDDLRRSAAPRVFEEILRMLGGPRPERAVELLARLGVLRVLFPELMLQSHAGGDDPRLSRLLARLAALGELDRGRRMMPPAIYLAVLFFDELLKRVAGADLPSEGPHHAPSQALDDFLRPIGQRFRMARRDTARTRAMFLALRRIDPTLALPEGQRRRRRGGLAEFVRREFFQDALLLLRVVSVAERRDLAPVLEWERREQEILDAPLPSPRSPHHAHHAARAGDTGGDRSRGGAERGAEPAAARDLHDAREPPHEEARSGDLPPGRRRRRRRRRGAGGGAPLAPPPGGEFDS